MADDPVAAYLAGVRRRSRWRSNADEIAAPGATAIDSARDIPPLLAAVGAVLALHRRDHRKVPLCESCDYRWPCPTAQAVSRALLGEGE
jgi:hypothetical protein